MGKAPWIKTIAASETMRTRRRDIFRFPFAAPASVRLRSLCTLLLRALGCGLKLLAEGGVPLLERGIAHVRFKSLGA